MRIDLKDTIIIDYADKIRKCKLTNGLETIKFNEKGQLISPNTENEKLKVVLEGCNSNFPITINKKT